MSTLRLGFGAPPRLPSLEGFPDLLDGQWLNGQRLRPFDAAPALDRAEGGLLRRVEHLLMTSQCSEYGFFVVQGNRPQWARRHSRTATSRRRPGGGSVRGCTC